MTEKSFYEDCVNAKMCFVCEYNMSNSQEDPCKTCLTAWHNNQKDVPGFKESTKKEAK